MYSKGMLKGVIPSNSHRTHSTVGFLAGSLDHVYSLLHSDLQKYLLQQNLSRKINQKIIVIIHVATNKL